MESLPLQTFDQVALCTLLTIIIFHKFMVTILPKNVQLPFQLLQLSFQLFHFNFYLDYPIHRILPLVGIIDRFPHPFS
ncbi:Uncharacterised protein [Chlamydia trachomatis]|nr:Uncharacterised protein [Chlamydia trachomatis]